VDNRLLWIIGLVVLISMILGFSSCAKNIMPITVIFLLVYWVVVYLSAMGNSQR
jgi:predicted RND superfamily exporter protein